VNVDKNTIVLVVSSSLVVDGVSITILSSVLCGTTVVVNSETTVEHGSETVTIVPLETVVETG